MSDDILKFPSGMIRKDKIPYYPAINRYGISIGGEHRVYFETYVRIKRGRKWYVVFLRETHTFVRDGFNVFPNSPEYLAIMFQRLMWNAEQIRHLFVIIKNPVITSLQQLPLQEVDPLQMDEKERIEHLSKTI